MKIKIKTRPEDFIVEEIAELPLKNRGDFCVYRLEKSRHNTIELLAILADKFKLPLKCFSYGGRKDKHAKTSQYIAVKSRKNIEIKAVGYVLKLCGYMDRPMGPDLIQGNSFKITVRELTQEDVDSALKEKTSVESFGYPNYFDDQRFGSVDPVQGFLAEKILQGHFNGALKIYLTAMSGSDRKDERERKLYFYRNWKDWQACLAKSKTRFEREAFSGLVKGPDGFITALKKIPREQLSIYFSAYQSYIWNEVLRCLIKERFGTNLLICPGLAGDYVFYSELKPQEYAGFETLTIPTMPVKTKIDDTIIAKVYQSVLEKNKIKNALFNKLKIRQAFFKSTMRQAIIKPQNLIIHVTEDELYKGKYKLVLNFYLTRGSFGTMFLKRLFCA